MPTKRSEAETIIYAAVGHALTTWASLESEVCAIYRETVSPLAHEPTGALKADSPAEDAFWAIVSFEGKLDMTGAAVQRLLAPKTTSENALLLSEWTRVCKRIGEKSSKRNKLAHGSIFNLQTPSGVVCSFAPRFYQSTTGFRLSLGGPGTTIQLISKPPEELWTAQRIDSVRKGFEAGIIRLQRFHHALREHNKAWSAREAATKQYFDAMRLGRTAIDNRQPPQPSEG